MSDPDPLSVENLSLKRENRQLKEELNRTKSGVNKIKDNDYMTKFYTEPIDDIEQNDEQETAQSDIESDEEIESGVLSHPAKRTKIENSAKLAHAEDSGWFTYKFVIDENFSK